MLPPSPSARLRRQAILLILLIFTATACGDLSEDLVPPSVPPDLSTATPQALTEADAPSATEPEADLVATDPPPGESPAPGATEEIRPGDPPQEPPGPPVLPTSTPPASDEAWAREPAPRRAPVEVDEEFARSQDAFERQHTPTPLAEAEFADPDAPATPEAVAADHQRELAKVKFLDAEGWSAPAAQP